KRSLGEHSLKFLDVKGRRKHLYSTWKKITERNKDFSEIYDLFAIRIIVQDIKDCYGVLGVIHGLWIPMEDRVKDYISKPKSNGYKSIHTTVYVEGEPMEIQIRTLEMHMVNEFGPAAHWAYKEHRDMNRKDLPWLRRIADWQKDSADAESGVRNALEDANEANIYVCTPKGDLIDIAPGSTPIDFAYLIHTDVGHKCVGAKVNSSIVPLTYRLQLGDMVEIITSNTAAPKLGWLQFCRTSKAKEKIRQWFKKEKRPENISRGRELIIDELRKVSKKDKRISESVINDEELMAKAAKCFNYSTSDDMIASIGYSETPASKIVQKLSELLPDDPEKMLERKKISSSSREELGKGVKVPGMENFMIVFAKCCNPIPGDSITGMLKFGTGISIHRKDCRNVREERCFYVEWTNRTSADRKYPIKLEMEIWDRYGVSAECISIINEMRVPLKEYNSKLKSGKDIIIMSIEVCNKEQLDIIIRKLSKIKGMISVSRTSGVKGFGRRGM
ncbi:MAG: TGS domain-containing protein, partial [bacterium]|nr:TGS domain-containing protein [bacterium]